MRVLITGITGFVGSHMAEYALAKGAEVFGSIRWRSKTENIDHLRSKVTFIESDLRDLSSVRSLLEISDPDYIVHLAAQSFVGVSWQAPAETLTTNIISQVNLLEALRGPQDVAALPRRSARARSTGSSTRTSCRSRRRIRSGRSRPYAVSKVTQDMMALPVLQELRPADHPHARLQPRGPAARRRLRHVELRPAGGRDRGRAARSGDLRRRPHPAPRLLRRARHRARLLALARARRAGRGLQPLLGQVVADPAGPRLPARALHGQGHHGPDRPGAAASLRRDGPRGRSVEDRQGHRLEGRRFPSSARSRSCWTTGGSGPASSR